MLRVSILLVMSLNSGKVVSRGSKVQFHMRMLNGYDEVVQKEVSSLESSSSRELSWTVNNWAVDNWLWISKVTILHVSIHLILSATCLSMSRRLLHAASIFPQDPHFFLYLFCHSFNQFQCLCSWSCRWRWHSSAWLPRLGLSFLIEPKVILDTLWNYIKWSVKESRFISCRGNISSHLTLVVVISWVALLPPLRW